MCQSESCRLSSQEPSSAEWATGALGALCETGVAVCDLPFSVDGLKPNSTLHVRVLLLDKDMNSFDGVPYIVVRTEGERKYTVITEHLRFQAEVYQIFQL